METGADAKSVSLRVSSSETTLCGRLGGRAALSDCRPHWL